MDFFADGGFQQLFCELNDQQTFVIWNKPVDANYSATANNFESHYHTTQDIRQFQEENCLYYEQDYNETPMEQQHDHDHVTEINDKQLQASLDYLLNTSHESTEDCELLTRLTPMPFLSPELSDWEEKFLDNYIEIPELVDILPEKTPLCTDTCNHFLQESAENLKLYPSPPSSPDCSSLFPAGSCSNAKENYKSYPCSFGDCRKVYAKPAHLKAHLRRHLGEKPYACNWPNCTWRFSRSDELSRHRRSHSGVKPYECNFCAKCFARSDHLTKHRKVHERRLQAAQKAGKAVNGVLPACVLTVRPGRKRKNQL